MRRRRSASSSRSQGWQLRPGASMRSRAFAKGSACSGDDGAGTVAKAAVAKGHLCPRPHEMLLAFSSSLRGGRRGPAWRLIQPRHPRHSILKTVPASMLVVSAWSRAWRVQQRLPEQASTAQKRSSKKKPLPEPLVLLCVPQARQAGFPPRSQVVQLCRVLGGLGAQPRAPDQDKKIWPVYGILVWWWSGAHHQKMGSGAQIARSKQKPFS